jgi:hypothetical protein
LADAEHQIDFSRLRFPSDAMTVGYLRERFPESFEGLDPQCFREGQDDVAALIEGERTLAKWAFDNALGRSTVSQDEWDAQEQSLELTYPDVGFATGPQHARQLVRNLKKAAVAQARKHLGKGR